MRPPVLPSLFAPVMLTASALAIPACADDGAPLAKAEAPLSLVDGGVDTSEVPPTGAAVAIDAWLAAGHYRSWACEPAPHPARPPSGHSPNRVCSNAKASAHGAGEYPVGAANVKELFDPSGVRIVGYAIELKTAAGGGDSWYWYERLDDRGVIANGLGSSGPAKTICARCHARAGTSVMLGHDFVFTQVRDGG